MQIDAMDVLSAASDWREALASLRSLGRKSSRETKVACEHMRTYMHTRLFEGEQAVRADAKMHNAVLDACSRSSHWAEADAGLLRNEPWVPFCASYGPTESSFPLRGAVALRPNESRSESHSRLFDERDCRDGCC